MSLSEIFNILGTIITCISVVSAFVLYRFQKRDEHVNKVINTLQQQYGNIQTLIRLYTNGYISYEIAKEVVDSEESEHAMKEMYELYKLNKAQKSNLPNIESEISNQINRLGGYFKGYYMCKFDDLLENTSKLSSVYCSKYRGLYYFMDICIYSLRHAMEALVTKELYLDIVKVFFFSEDRDSEYFVDVDTYDDFKHSFFDWILNYLYFANLGYLFQYIHCIGELNKLVCVSHIMLPMRKWHKLAYVNFSKDLNFSLESLECATSRFSMLKKYFSIVFDEKQFKEYDRLVAEINGVFKTN